MIVNPWAGVGGPTGLRGSDGPEIRDAALAAGVIPRAGDRCGRFLDALTRRSASKLEMVVWGGPMGADLVATTALACIVAGMPAHTPSTPDDTQAAARALAAAGVDLLVFVGGDGTARDVCAATGTRVPVLGVPAGVKMYSGVFAVSPEAAAEVVHRLVEGQPVTVQDAEVRDIDEEAFRQDRVASRWFGDLRVPGTGNLVQQVKCGRPANEVQEQRDIAEWVASRMEPGVVYLVGTGSTPKAVMDVLGLAGSLLGVDAVLDGECIATNLDGTGLAALVRRYPATRILLTVTGGQGFLLGRGNQQLSAEVLRAAGSGNLVILATRDKLEALAGRPLLVDTGDVALDRELAGLKEVVTGYDRRVLYRVAAAVDVGVEP
ncbi:MAG: ATP-NAD kinase family protein [Gammaproteobacteria bacterium]